MSEPSSFGYRVIERVRIAKSQKVLAGSILTPSETADIINDMFAEEAGKLEGSRKAIPANSRALAVYQAYPRHVGKTKALKAIEQAIKAGGADILERTTAYALAVAKWPASEKQFVPHPATWFNRGSYLDDPKEWQRGKETQAKANNYTTF